MACGRGSACPVPNRSGIGHADRRRARLRQERACTVEPDVLCRSHDELLGCCYTRCLQLAEARGLRILSFPSIGTGSCQYPLGEAAEVAMETVVNHMTAATGSLETVTFVLFDDRTLDAFEAALPRRAKPPS